MSPLIALHATSVACRDSIRRRGLLPGQPNESRPYGVYVYSDGVGNRGSRCRNQDGSPRIWDSLPAQDVWQVAYIGPMAPDVYIANALILFDRIEPEYITLVTRNGR